MIKSAISSTVYTRLVSTTSIVAKLAVCAILLAGIDSADAANANANDGAGAKAAVHRPAAKATLKKLARLEREWKRLHSERQVGMLNRLVACRELGRCDGLNIPPTLGTALIRSAAADAEGGDMNAASLNAASLPYGGALPINP